jgi:hypothetical protein
MKVGRAIGCMAVKKMRPFRCHADLAGDQGDAQAELIDDARRV